VLETLGHQLDVIFGWRTPEQWEAIRGWLTTLGGLAAVIIALITYMRNVRTNKEEQARKVYASSRLVKRGREGHSFKRPQPTFATVEGAGEWARTGLDEFSITLTSDVQYFRLAVHNSSEELIGPVILKSRHRYADESIVWGYQRFGFLKPGSAEDQELVVPLDGDGLAPEKIGLFLIFRDSSGRWWTRSGTSPIKKAKEPTRSLDTIPYTRPYTGPADGSPKGDPSANG
jgi:hypothetical protein